MTFNLAAHYEIDTAEKYWFTTLNKEFESNVSVSKTQFDAVQIEVFDKDPQIASNMIDSIIQYYNETVRRMHREKHEEVVTLKKLLLNKVTREVDSLEAIKRSHQTQDLESNPLKGLIMEPKIKQYKRVFLVKILQKG